MQNLRLSLNLLVQAGLFKTKIVSWGKRPGSKERMRAVTSK